MLGGRALSSPLLSSLELGPESEEFGVEVFEADGGDRGGLSGTGEMRLRFEAGWDSGIGPVVKREGVYCCHVMS